VRFPEQKYIPLIEASLFTQTTVQALTRASIRALLLTQLPKGDNKTPNKDNESWQYVCSWWCMRRPLPSSHQMSIKKPSSFIIIFHLSRWNVCGSVFIGWCRIGHKRNNTFFYPNDLCQWCAFTLSAFICIS